ncbi:hypothetical protein DES53_11937 [Roseimicrobium gellanilyticum]|uniref:DUF1795 domain-containing protein n=1 Tax=Roseimicrobium gellanilyticum TaxID=748857 RepID=A0A366H1V4_9BACT|nr:hypothetical protein [Roseimicrobium gellanilyticum]RBP35871.1 hypothetical protein DES53_11937 [Roseimicrobium gellanilyticum]
MKTASRFGLASLVIVTCGLFAAVLRAQVPDVPETFPNGVVYGPKAAFAIAAPNGWVLDNKSGAADGLPCVLYPKDATWHTAPVVMYAKIASTTHEDAKEFVKVAIEHMTKQRAGFTHRLVASGKTNEGLEWFINEYPATESYPRVERVAYVQMPKAVAFMVMSAESADVSARYAVALEDVVASFKYKEEFIGYVPPKVGEKGK